MNLGSLTRWSLLLLVVLAAPSSTWASAFERDFVVVYIDAKTEAKFGAIPLNRGVLAEGIEAIAKAGAKGLVLKFFLDQAKDERDDKRLAGALSRIPTVLQARLDDAERSANLLADRFTVAESFGVAVKGASGWIPLPAFASQAKDIGFVDFNSPLVPMVEQYQSHTVKSLILCAIELAANQRARLHGGRNIEIGSHVIQVDGKNQALAKLRSSPLRHSVSFNAVLDGSARNELKNKVVILAYDGPHIDTLSTAWGPMGTHAYFVNILKSIYDGE